MPPPLVEGYKEVLSTEEFFLFCSTIALVRSRKLSINRSVHKRRGADNDHHRPSPSPLSRPLSRHCHKIEHITTMWGEATKRWSFFIFCRTAPRSLLSKSNVWFHFATTRLIEWSLKMLRRTEEKNVFSPDRSPRFSPLDMMEPKNSYFLLVPSLLFLLPLFHLFGCFRSLSMGLWLLPPPSLAPRNRSVVRAARHTQDSAAKNSN